MKLKSFTSAAVSLILLAAVGACVSRADKGGHSGLYPIIQNGKYGYVDGTGAVVINPRYNWAGDFYNEVGKVTVGRKDGFIDKSGQFVVEPQFDTATHFSEGLAPVEISNARWGLYRQDRQGGDRPSVYERRPFLRRLSPSLG